MIQVYHSYWSAGYAGTPDPFLVDLHRLSAYLAKKHYGKVHLVTDSRAVESLGNLGYDSVSTELDQLPLKYAQVWSLGKIWTYIHAASKGQPFMHIDYDVLLWKPLPVEMTNSPLFAERIELDVNKRYGLNRFFSQCPNPHDLVGSESLDGAINAGIVGGYNTDFLLEAYSKTWNFVMDPINADYMTGPPDSQSPSWSRATIAEQLYFYNYARKHNQNIVCLLNTLLNRDKDKEASKLGYTHVWGAKKNKEIRAKILAKCKEFGLPVASEEHGIKWLAKGAIKAAQALVLEETEQSKARLAICGGCDQWTGKSCKQCGCFTALKVKIPEEKCPLEKW